MDHVWELHIYSESRVIRFDHRLMQFGDHIFSGMSKTHGGPGDAKKRQQCAWNMTAVSSLLRATSVFIQAIYEILVEARVQLCSQLLWFYLWQSSLQNFMTKELIISALFKTNIALFHWGVELTVLSSHICVLWTWPYGCWHAWVVVESELFDSGKHRILGFELICQSTCEKL